MKILLIDDDPVFRESIQDILEMENFEIATASSGKEALENVYGDAPSLIIVDMNMPGMDGLELSKRIKDDILLNYIPIIILTGQGDVQIKEKALEYGCDDYILKPCDPVNFIQRVKWVISRSSRDISANPLTRLPGNWVIIKRLDELIKKSMSFAVLYIDINNFKSFNDKYGFVQGDDIIKMTAHTFSNAVKAMGLDQVFIGHIGGDDFIMITEEKYAEELCKKIIEEFDRNVRNFYNEEDRKAGFIIGKDRQGKVNKFSIMSIAIAVVINKDGKIKHLGHVNQVGAEIKKFLKQKDKSAYMIDRRMD